MRTACVIRLTLKFAGRTLSLCFRNRPLTLMEGIRRQLFVHGPYVVTASYDTIDVSCSASLDPKVAAAL